MAATSSSPSTRVMHSYYCEVPTHKPDRMVPPVEGQPRARTVAIPSQKGRASFQYALNFIRERIGKNPLPSQERQREYELICSERRKSFTAIADYSLALIYYEQFVDEFKRMKTNIDMINTGINFSLHPFHPHIVNETWPTKEGVRLFLPMLKSVINRRNLHDEVTIKPFTDFLAQETYDDFREFVMRAEKAINLRFLHRIMTEEETDASIAFQLETMIGDMPGHCECRNVQATRYLAHKKCVEILGLHVSQDHIFSSVSALLEELQTNGPLVVEGSFGRAFYTSDPVLSGGEEVTKRPVYIFQTGTPRKNIGAFVQSAVVVGAKEVEQVEDVVRGIPRKTKGFVYYIVPSEPDRVYKTSFGTFKESVRPLFGIPDEDSPAYAVHGDARRLL